MNFPSLRIRAPVYVLKIVARIFLKVEAVVRVAQVFLDAKGGYVCDYCTKGLAIDCNGIKECCKGHDVDLTKEFDDESVGVSGKLRALRIMNDAYGKSIVRGPAENTMIVTQVQGCLVSSSRLA